MNQHQTHGAILVEHGHRHRHEARSQARDMTREFTDFRLAVLGAAKALLASQPGMQMHLLYLPELADPLPFANDTRRTTRLVYPQRPAGVDRPDPATLPRLITLDCRCVAAYLLETDPALDDPLFEASITQAHADICASLGPQTASANHESWLPGACIGGWLFRAGPSFTITSRFRELSLMTIVDEQPLRLRWTHPAYISAVWPLLRAGQRRSLLGDATWLSFDPTGQLKLYEPPVGNLPRPHRDPAELARANAQQAATLKNALLVGELLKSWGALCEAQGDPLPADAEQQLHRHVLSAQQAGLDDDSVALSAMVAVQLPPQAGADAVWVSLLQRAARSGTPLRALLDELPADFWQRWCAVPH